MTSNNRCFCRKCLLRKFMELRLENVFVDIWPERIQVRNPVVSVADMKI